MGISDRILGKSKPSSNGRPHIDSVFPIAALPGGEVRIAGSHLTSADWQRPIVHFGDTEGAIVISSADVVIARVPEEASSGMVIVSTNGTQSNAFEMKVAVPVAENLHPVTNPAMDAQGNIFVTYSGARGQKVPVSIYKI